MNEPVVLNTAHSEFEPAFIAMLQHVTEEFVSFNKVLGLKLGQVQPAMVTATMEMKPELVGHPAIQRIHGGAISAALDAMAGIAVMAAMGHQYREESLEQRIQRFGKLGTIDLRVDYMRPGIGERFQIRAEVLRLGSRVATTRMEFMNEAGEALAAGMASYIVS